VTAAGEHDATSVWSAAQTDAEQLHSWFACAQQCPDAGGEHVSVSVMELLMVSHVKHSQAPDASW
jgi:hypothetical protein